MHPSIARVRLKPDADSNFLFKKQHLSILDGKHLSSVDSQEGPSGRSAKTVAWE
jgi:hypothetical protein